MIGGLDLIKPGQLPDIKLSDVAFGLSARRRLFVMYLFGLGPKGCLGDPVRSAKAAGFVHEDSAERLLAEPRVRMAIELHLLELTGPGQVLAQLAAIAESDIGDMLIDVPELDKDGEPTGRTRKALSMERAVEMDMTGLIRKIKYNERSGNLEIEMHDKMQALRLLMRYHGMIVDRSVQARVDFRDTDHEIDRIFTAEQAERGARGNPVEVEHEGEGSPAPPLGLLGTRRADDAG